MADSTGAREVAEALTAADSLKPAVEHALQEDPRTRAGVIDVAVLGSTVTLTGTVDSAEAKAAAERAARSISGVVAVTNELLIGAQCLPEGIVGQPAGPRAREERGADLYGTWPSPTWRARPKVRRPARRVAVAACAVAGPPFVGFG